MKRIIQTDKAPGAIGPYSQAVEASGTLYISGQIPLDPKTGEILEGSIADQTVRVMESIKEILKAAGYTLDNVVKYTCLLVNLDNFAAINEVLRNYYPENPPARATYEVSKLPLGVSIEIETIAVK